MKYTIAERLEKGSGVCSGTALGLKVISLLFLGKSWKSYSDTRNQHEQGCHGETETARLHDLGPEPGSVMFMMGDFFHHFYHLDNVRPGLGKRCS